MQRAFLCFFVGLDDDVEFPEFVEPIPELLLEFRDLVDLGGYSWERGYEGFDVFCLVVVAFAYLEGRASESGPFGVDHEDIRSEVPVECL